MQFHVHSWFPLLVIYACPSKLTKRGKELMRSESTVYKSRTSNYETYVSSAFLKSSEMFFKRVLLCTVAVATVRALVESEYSKIFKNFFLRMCFWEGIGWDRRSRMVLGIQEVINNVGETDWLHWSTKYDLCVHRMKYIISRVVFCAESKSDLCFLLARQVFKIHSGKFFFEKSQIVWWKGVKSF